MASEDKGPGNVALPVKTGGGGHLRVVDEGGRALADPIFPVGLNLEPEVMRKRRWPIALSFVVVAILPALVAFLYFTEVAAPRYVGEARVAVRSTEARMLASVGEALGLPGRTPVSQDAQALVQYLGSRAVLDDLPPEIDLQSLFGHGDIDWLSRLRPDARIEDELAIWVRRVKVTFESSNDTVLLRVTSFAPEDTLVLLDTLLSLSDSFINRLSENARADAVDFARGEVTRAEARLTAARTALVEFQDRSEMFDPNRNADAAEGLVNSLQDRITGQRAILATQLTQLGEDAPSVLATRQIISGLESELARLREATNAGGETGVTGDAEVPLTQRMREFQEVSGEVEFAQRAYESALSAYEAARIDADRRHIFLATVVAPALPEKVSFPRPVQDSLTVLAIAFGIWLIGLIAVHSIRDHL